MNETPLLTTDSPPHRRTIWRLFPRNLLFRSGAALLLLFVLLAVCGPLLVPNDPLTVDMSKRLLPPSFEYPLGTDHLGRCLFARLAEGAQVTLGVSALVIVSVALIGIPFGLIAGTSGGRLDAWMMRLVDGCSALPEFVLAIAIAGFLGPSLSHLLLSIIVIKWISYARVVRSIVLAEREKEYVLAAYVAGTNKWTVMRRHLLPQLLSPICVLAALDVGKVIMLISMFSFLGLGAQPPTPEWGAMLNDGRPYFQTVPALMILPGVAIVLVVIACNLLADGLRDHWDVRSQ